MATAEKRVVTDATGQAMLAELRKIPGVMNPVPVEKGGTGVTTPEEILELIGAQPKFDFDVEEQLNAAVKSVNEIKPDAQGNVQILRVPMADNFTSDEAQVVSGAFIERTTGGDASINDGSATLGVLYGNSIRSGYVAESTNMEVQLAGRFDDSIPLSATISWDAYKAAVNYISTNKTFTYTTAWNENPETYGITLSGTPASGDVINVYFIAENRGTIANTTPETFVQTNWNLYDFDKGYARVLKYSDEYGFKIGGYYTGVSFAETVEGEKTVITPDSDGLFDVPSDGYVFVTGGNNTDTYILMTWSDWHDGYTGDYLTYAESVIDFSELMSNVFPYGMCAIGITMDEINFNDKTAIVRIERVAYTTENRILAEQSGREFVYDSDWIYSVKETPERVRFNIENDLVVYDHGIEFFTGTEVPVLAYELFGQNLKDKLRREVVAVTPQSFSASQKAQARENIEAAWNSEVIKSINNKVPDANGNITIVEGQSNASYGSYRIDPVIPPAAWTLVNGQYQVAYFDPLIKATMTGAETWLDDNDVMLGATHFSTVDGALMIVTEVQPTDTWRLHVLLAENGATVLEEVHNKAEESTVAIVETGDTAFHAITTGQYVMWKGVLYKASSDISVGSALSGKLNIVTNGLGEEVYSLNNQYGIYGDLSNPVTDLSVLPDYGRGYVVLGAEISPTNAVHAFSFVKNGTKNRYDIIVTRIVSAGTGDTYVGQMYDGTFGGWIELAKNSDVVNKSAMIILDNAINTPALMHNALYSVLTANGQTGTVYMSSSALANLTSNAVTGKGSVYGTAYRPSSTTLRFDLTATNGYKFVVEQTNISTSSYGTSVVYSISDQVNGIEIAENTDLNTLTTPGDYYSPSSSRSATLINSPTTLAGFSLTVKKQGSNINQFVQFADDIYTRGTGSSGTTWGSWTRIPKGTVDNLTSTSTAAALSANQGKVLKDMIGDIRFKSLGTIKSGTSRTLTFIGSAAVRFVLVGFSSADARTIMSIVVGQKDGNCYVTEIYNGSSITHTEVSGAITFSSSASQATSLFALVFNGSPDDIALS